MQSRHILVIIAIISLVVFGSFNAWSQQSEPPLTSPQAPSPGRPQGPPPAGAMCTDGQNLYVLQGPWIYQFSATDLSLKNTVQLPRPEPPEGQRQKAN